MKTEGQNSIKERISVIVPAYKAEAFLRGCIESILRSEGVEVEILLVENASPDRTMEISRELETEHSNIHVLEAGGRGVSAARNLGIERASGEYLCFVDADDSIHPLMLKTLLMILKQEQADVSGCGFLQVHVPGQVPEIREEEREELKKPEAFLFTGDEFLQKDFFSGNTRIWSKLFTKEVLREKRFPEDLTIGEDMFFLLSLTEDPKTRFAMIREPLYHYYVNPAGAMLRPFTLQYLDQVSCWEKAEEFIRTKKSQLYEENRELRDQITAKTCTGIMLAAQKLSELPGKERERYCEVTGCLQKKLRSSFEKLSRKDVLPGGYPQKIRLFLASPAVYYQLYGTLRKLIRRI